MPAESSRRDYLVGAGCVLGLGAAGPAAAQTTVDCEPQSEAPTGGSDQGGDLQAQLDALNAEIARLETEIDAQRTRQVERKKTYPDDVRAAARAVGEAARESVVFIDVVTEYGGGTATGWVVDDGRILTNAHNTVDFEVATEKKAWTLDGTSTPVSLVAKVSGGQPDVALLSADVDVPALPVGSSSSLTADQPVAQVGHPGGFGNWVISLGDVVEVGNSDVTTTVPGLQGNSGSPLLDLDGTVVGMTSGAEPGSAASEVEPAAPTPHYERLATDSPSLHVPIETAMERVEAWT